MEIKEAMQTNIVKVASTTTITEAAKIMDKNNIGCVLVNDFGGTVGIMTERDILRKIAAQGKNCEETVVKEIMSSSLITIDLKDTLDKANELMAKHKIRRLVVTENDDIVGIITIRDVAQKMRYSLAKRILSSDEGSHIRPNY